MTLVLAGSSCLTLAASGCPTALIKLQGKAPPRLQCLRCLLHRLIHNRSVLQAGLPLGGYVRLCLGGGGVSPFGHLMLWQELDICSSSFTFAACLLTIVIIPILPAPFPEERRAGERLKGPARCHTQGAEGGVSHSTALAAWKARSLWMRFKPAFITCLGNILQRV